MNTHPLISNPQNEKLDVLVEGNEKSTTTIIMVHGLGTDKHETAGQFDYVTQELSDHYRIVRFDFSGFGKSEGRTEDFDYFKHAEDLKAVLSYTKQTFGGAIYIIAQSMGTFVTALLNPKDVVKTVFMGIPNSNTEYIIDRLQKRIASRPGAHIDLQGISLIPRSSGEVQKWGSQFWKTLKEFKPVTTVSKFAKNTSLLIIHPKQDEVVGPDFQKEYDTIQNIKVEWINGDHSFKKWEDRLVLIERIKTFFS